jgi:demethylmenaquinone methyltransferase/2-methoxy-6-polyprenyl-1,4-benzoquinol methylase
MAGDENASSFGFRDVPRSDKARLVRGVFSSVASRYDLMNDLMSGGAHRMWKSAFLAAGRARGDAGGRLQRVVADAERLPLPDRVADAVSVAFGIRNMTDIDAALRQAFRVLRPGGRFYCLEFSHPVTEGLQKLYDAYSFNVIPWLGETVAGDRDSYQYLVESIRRFPKQEAFAAMIGKAGFRRVRCENLSGGVVAIHSGWRL